MGSQLIGVDTFSAENIRNCEEHVLSMQRRLDKAVADNDRKSIRETFDLLTKRSNAVKVLATWEITQRNQGKYTAGVDGIAIPKGETREVQSQIRHKIMDKVDLEKKPDAIRRVYIPKPNGKQRPLGIPTLYDRIVQGILRIGLEPIVEYHFNGNSYGFRPKRSCQDAMEHLYLKLALENRPKYVIEGDIKGCFDNIKHDHIIRTLEEWQVPKWVLEIIMNMLKSKIFHNGEVYDSDTGTPQGGVISPLLANVALTTLDNFCNKFVKGTKRKNPIVRYADDFVIVSRSELEAKQIKQEVAEYLLEKTGLTLSDEKTKITHIYKGFNFLGFNFKKYKIQKKGGVKRVLRIQPQKEKVSNLLKECQEVLKNHATATQEGVIRLLTPKIKGWGMYYRHVFATNTFGRTDGKLWEKLYRWAKRRHPNKSKRWVMRRYFHKSSDLKFHFMDKEKNVALPLLSKIPRKRFIKINNDFRVYDGAPETVEYWEKREYLNALDQIGYIKRRTLFQRQEGKCTHCHRRITDEDIQRRETHVHHVIPRSQGGTNGYSNLRLIHMECHKEIHGKKS